MGLQWYLMRLSLLLCYFLLHCSVFSFGQVISTTEIKNQEGLFIHKRMLVYEDASKELAIEDLIKQRGSFVDVQRFEAKNSKSHFWVKTQLSNDHPHLYRALVKFSFWSHVTLYAVKDGEIIEIGNGGAYAKGTERRAKDGLSHVRLDVPTQAIVDVYFKIRQRKGFMPQFQFTLFEAEDYQLLAKDKYFKDALIFGCFAIFFIYGLIVYIQHRHRPYLWLSLTVLLKGVFFLQMLGYLNEIFVPNYPKVSMDMLVFLMYGSGITTLLLVRDFLKLKTDYPLYYKGINLFNVFLALQSVVIFGIKYTKEDFLLANMIGFSSFIPQGIFVVYVMVKLIPKIPKFKRPVMIGVGLYTGLSLFTSVNFLMNLENSYRQYTSNEVIGSFAFLFVFFYTLGHEMELNNVEKNKALRQINTMIEGQKEELNKQVKERTFELEQSKEEITAQNSKLSERNDQIEVLLKEVHHRVKNNLQIVSSLLKLQTKRTEDKAALAAMTDGQNRVKAMALIHQGLYQNNDMSSINFQDYAEQLLTQLASIYLGGRKVNYVVHSSEIELDIDTAVPLGLILNELLTNSFKYAFDEPENGKIEVELSKQEDGFVLNVSDNGKGLPDGFDWENATSIGLRLVDRLSEQLYGSFSYKNQNGANFSIKFQDTLTRKLED